jgi:hypothetical protein
MQQQIAAVQRRVPMNANDLHAAHQPREEITTNDAWILARLLIASAAMMTFVTFSYVLA